MTGAPPISAIRPDRDKVPAMATDAPEKQSDNQPLKRVITRPLLTIFILGDILGTGIYALVGEVGGEVGGAIWTSFLAAIVIALLTAFAYAELVTKYPHAAGAARYVHTAFRKSFFTFMVAFAVMASGITSASAAARVFGGDYLAEFVKLPVVAVAFAFVIVLALINFRGISESVKVNLLFTLIEVLGLLFIILIGVVALVGGDGDPGRAFEFNSETALPLAIANGAALAFFAMVGFEDSVNVAEETKEPSKIFPPALFTGLIVAGIVYVLVAMTASMVVPTGRLVGSSGPLLEVVKLGPIDISPKIFSVVALVAVSNSALINLIMASRLAYGMGNQGIIPSIFSRVHRSRQTPWVSIIFTSGIALALIATTDVEALGATTAALLLAVFTVVNITVLVLRRDLVDHKHFVAPSAIPVVAAIACALLLTRQEVDVLLRALILVGIGVGLYVLNWLVAGRTEELKAEELKG